ncbi:MAG: ion transporter [Deltaproteobacteria bacterium]|nr:ion transporter [Deltaproteobacteria bacterium]
MTRKARKLIFEILETVDNSLGKIFQLSMMTLISLNVLAVILATVESLSSRYSAFFKIFEVFSVAVFTIEYFLRLWSCAADERFESPVTGRVKFALTPLAIVDLLAILPFYLPMLVPFDLRLIRGIRLFRLFRLFKMGRYSRSLKTFGSVLKSKKEDLVMTVFIVLFLLVIASCIMYFAEHGAQPEVFSSIPTAMWWAADTLTTLGYGNIQPITPIGKLLGAVIALLGIGLFALPAGILASGFVEELQKRRTQQTICPHCGNVID